MTLILNRYAITFRADIVTTLMDNIRQGESSCVVGLAGAGKSNLATFLAQPEVMLHYRPHEVDRLHVIRIACRPGNQPKNELYEAMLFPVLVLATHLDPTVESTRDPSVPPFFSLREAVRTVCQVHGHRLIFVFDEFESLIQYQPAGVFEDLRTLRDDQRTYEGVTYITITHHLPHRVPGNTSFAGGGFFELIRNHIYPLGPYRPPDASAMIDELVKRQDLPGIDDTDRQRIIYFSGGHGDLLKALFYELMPLFHVPGPRLLALAKTSPAIRASCQHIWEHLHDNEQRALQLLDADQPVPAPWLDFLAHRGLLTQLSPPTIFSPLFREYVRLL